VTTPSYPSPPIALSNSPPPLTVIIAVPGANPSDAVPERVVPSLTSAAPPPPPPKAKLIRPPQQRRLPQDYVSTDDYPPVAIAMREQGRVVMRLDIGPDGRVSWCAVQSSSGSSSLDSVSCRLMLRRARFTPAIDSNGNAAAGSIVQALDWKLP
jgi:protein TonB